MPICHKDIVTHISRAKAGLAKLDALRTLREVVEGLRLMNKNPVLVGRERIELEFMLDEVARSLSALEEMKSLFPRGLTFQKGQEKDLLARLEKVLEGISSAINKAETDKLRNRYNEIDRHLIQGQKLLEIKNPIEARKAFRRCQEMFPDEPGLNHDIGTRLLRAGLAAESIEYFEAAMARDPRDARAFAAVVAAQEAVGETEKALDMVKTIFRSFGANERLYLKLAELNYKLRQWDACYDAAKAAHDMNPCCSHAKAIMDKVASKIF